MKKYFVTIALGLIAATIPAISTAAHECPGESTWVNQSGSTVQIEDIDSEGKITGLYINRASGFGCQDTPYPVTGWVLEGTNTITFSVKWENTTENCQSLTSWTGFFNTDCSKMSTLWYLVPNGASTTAQILKGSDTFTPISQTLSTLVQEPQQ